MQEGLYKNKHAEICYHVFKHEGKWIAINAKLYTPHTIEDKNVKHFLNNNKLVYLGGE